MTTKPAQWRELIGKASLLALVAGACSFVYRRSRRTVERSDETPSWAGSRKPTPSLGATHFMDDGSIVLSQSAQEKAREALSDPERIRALNARARDAFDQRWSLPDDAKTEVVFTKEDMARFKASKTIENLD